MICPNDQAEMHEVTVMSHYDLPVVLDQCPSCGGIWFDKAELYRAKHGEAAKVEMLDQAALATHEALGEAPLFCPRDKKELIRFTDKFFPRDIVLLRCPVCGGIWLNCGEFVKFQTQRQERQQKSRSHAREPEFEAKVKQILEANRNENAVVMLDNLGRFLNMPVNTDGSFAGDPAAAVQSPGNRAMDMVMSVLSLILSAVTGGRFW